MKRSVLGLLVALAIVLVGLWGVPAAIAQPTPSTPRAGPVDYEQRVVCERPGGIPAGVFVWAQLITGKIVWDAPALFFKSLPKNTAIYVYRPDDPICRMVKSTATAPPSPARPDPANATAAAPSKPAEATKQEDPRDQRPAQSHQARTAADLKKNLEERRRRALKMRADREPPGGSVSGGEIARERDEEAASSLLPTVRRSQGATPMTTSACPGCGAVVHLDESAAPLFRCRPVDSPPSLAFGYLTTPANHPVRARS